jgi:hypothetical protein
MTVATHRIMTSIMMGNFSKCEFNELRDDLMTLMMDNYRLSPGLLSDRYNRGCMKNCVVFTVFQFRNLPREGKYMVTTSRGPQEYLHPSFSSLLRQLLKGYNIGLSVVYVALIVLIGGLTPIAVAN